MIEVHEVVLMQLWWHILGMAGQILEKELQVETVGVYLLEYLLKLTSHALKGVVKGNIITGYAIVLILNVYSLV